MGTKKIIVLAGLTEVELTDRKAVQLLSRGWINPRLRNGVDRNCKNSYRADYKSGSGSDADHNYNIGSAVSQILVLTSVQDSNIDFSISDLTSTKNSQDCCSAPQILTLTTVLTLIPINRTWRCWRLACLIWSWPTLNSNSSATGSELFGVIRSDWRLLSKLDLTSVWPWKSKI